jgi:uncharacterized protein (TIGR03437 family)
MARLYQANVIVPLDARPGMAVPISLSVGGVPSQGGVTIAVE